MNNIDLGFWLVRIMLSAIIILGVTSVFLAVSILIMNKKLIQTQTDLLNLKSRGHLAIPESASIESSPVNTDGIPNNAVMDSPVLSQIGNTGKN